MMANHEVVLGTTTFNASISACEKGGDWGHALQLFSVMAQNSQASREEKLDGFLGGGGLRFQTPFLEKL